ncbi:MAG: hypothetical protein KDD66_14105 [Bdellovibrionales bacterium]|nr:hypothetical protein [Bdellovibrionales bacterium]
MRRNLLLTLSIFVFTLSAVADDAPTQEACQYIREDGTITIANSRAGVPEKYRSAAKCFTTKKPSEKKLSARQNSPRTYRSRSYNKRSSSGTVVCQYQKRDGSVAVANSKSEIPEEYLANAKCFQISDNSGLAKPDEIELEGTIRRQEISTSLGVIKLRWPRVVERDFGRTPSRAVIEAAKAVSRALHRPGFPDRVRDMQVDWNVVFLDEKLPEKQIPEKLISNCHPGWMTPPGNIYIVGQRAAVGCGAGVKVKESIADERLAEVLVHEMGHAVEWQLLHERGTFDRVRAEGFATWFEGYVAAYSSLLNHKQIMHRHVSAAKSSLKREPHMFLFRGDYESYARASMYFEAFVDRFGVGRLVDVYDLMAKQRMAFFTAVKEETSWNVERFDKELGRFVERAN